MQRSLKQIALNLFSEWCDNSSDVYPEMITSPADENLIVSDLTQTLYEAKEALIKHEKVEDRKEANYDYSFIMGYTWTVLNKKWFQSYIVKSTPQYKELTMLKSIWQYLRHNAQASQKINDIYGYTLNKELNTPKRDITFSSHNATRNKVYHLIELEEYPEKGTDVHCYLEQKIAQIISKISSVTLENYLPELEDYISPQWINLILCVDEN